MVCSHICKNETNRCMIQGVIEINATGYTASLIVPKFTSFRYRGPWACFNINDNQPLAIRISLDFMDTDILNNFCQGEQGFVDAFV